MKTKKGFSLIELIISVTIVGILAVVVLVVINPSKVQRKTRDAQRVNDLNSIKSALEIYISDKGTYPESGANSLCTNSHTWEKVGSISSSGQRSCLYQKLTEVTGGNSYLDAVPFDPSVKTTNASPADACTNSTADPYRYNYISSPTGDRYILTAIMEELDSVDITCASLSNWSSFGSVCGAPLTNCYGVQNP